VARSSAGRFRKPGPCIGIGGGAHPWASSGSGDVEVSSDVVGVVDVDGSADDVGGTSGTGRSADVGVGVVGELAVLELLVSSTLSAGLPKMLIDNRLGSEILICFCLVCFVQFSSVSISLISPNCLCRMTVDLNGIADGS
jgi:hypothetical protein